MSTKSKIIAHLPSSVELSKRTTQNVLRIDVKLAGAKEGSLHIARGSVEWWPDYNKVKAHRYSWKEFIAELEGSPKRRSKR